MRRAKSDITNETTINNIKKKNGEIHGTFTQLAAWGLPALQTVAVLVARLVDAEELLGLFYVLFYLSSYLFVCFFLSVLS